MSKTSGISPTRAPLSLVCSVKNDKISIDTHEEIREKQNRVYCSCDICQSGCRVVLYQSDLAVRFSFAQEKDGVLAFDECDKTSDRQLCSTQLFSSRSESLISLGILPQSAATGSLFSPRSRSRATKVRSLVHASVSSTGQPRRIIAKRPCMIRAFRATACHFSPWYSSAPTPCIQLFVLMPNSTIW